MKNLEELKIMRERVKKDLQLRAGKHRVKIVVGMGSCGIAAGARETMNEFLNLIEKSNKTDIIVTASGCFGFCAQEPMIHIYVEEKKPVTYRNVDTEAAQEIFNNHILNGKIVEKYLFSKGKE
ncbi:MAG: (2Fe-2S) ferredoxin domain-containing protein [Candidatus Caldatribacteriota bacterium]|jgi:(2Fe-2S) ferredoxin|nr:(2Fe-2S) ferredoxin domain-containing protein [Verrucomicrobiota bacterium]MDD2353411.1 (2Fe-2S) ferredoxin domain-containing protein [Atribacterota bacterium]MDD3031941.1 (2Fe-2S) ferredoxin domain-containing protein [Atribacterota bacterium]MDD3641786.1 (2Fe-2S) ferredoxin domain-containing protein [Atribacterota bacterium]MDD4289576.1 (2Fe-2S) ferredoxin domain-containing protein [Atribacterota bacterium]